MDTYTRGELTFDVTDAGPADGPVVVLLHGFPQDRRSWDLVTPLLNEAGLRTLAPDQRGYSPGATPRGRSAYAMSKLVGDVRALIDASGAQQAHVVGHDWGGAVAWAIAGALPDRVSGVTVCSTPHPSAMGWAMRHGDQLRRSAYMGFFQLPVISERRVAHQMPSMFRSTGLPQERASHYVRRFADPHSLTGPMGWYRAMASKSFVKSITQSDKRLASAQAGETRSKPVPTTYIWGSRDFALGRAAAEKTEDFAGPDYRFVELDAGHWIPETHATVIAEEIIDLVRRSDAEKA